jgi:hypothetical protein
MIISDADLAVAEIVAENNLEHDLFFAPQELEGMQYVFDSAFGS